MTTKKATKKTKTLKITARALSAKGACAEQVELFRETFGPSVTFTSKRAAFAAAAWDDLAK